MRLSPNSTVGFLFAFTVVLATAASASGPFPWSPPFADADQTTAEDALIVLVFTNDVHPGWLRMSKTRRPKGTPDSWCESAVVDAAGQIDPAYFHPSAPIYWQQVQLGLPPILTGGTLRGDVPRTFIVMTDGQYRFLEMLVGVPERSALSTLIEDAEETRMWMRQHCGDPRASAPDRMLDEIVSRNRDRLGRRWKSELDRQQKALGENAFQIHADGEIVNPLQDPLEFTELVRKRLHSIIQQLQSTYRSDAQLRFGLTEQLDIRRLAILEQHTDTRRSWVQCLSPFLAGTDVREIYVQLAESIWDCRVMPVQAEIFGHDEILAELTLTLSHWIENLGDEQPFALRMSMPLTALRHAPQRVAVSDVAVQRGLGWNDLDTELERLPQMQTDVLQLAAWLHQSSRGPVDLDRPSPSRTLFFRSASHVPLLIRDCELPGRFITMIRKVPR